MRQKKILSIAILLAGCSAGLVFTRTASCADGGAESGARKAVPTLDQQERVFDTWDGKGKVDTTKAPKWWLSGVEEGERLLRSLPGVKLLELGRSAGGRKILAAAWGDREDLPRTSESLGSALAGRSASAFYGRGRRKHQSLVFVGNAHGLEFEGTVATLNVLSAVSTGKDLRGRPWPRIQECGQKLRIVVIPHFNIDGRQRYAWYRQGIGIDLEKFRQIMFGTFKDGRKMDWPANKVTWPIPVDQVTNLGVYYNDNGVNLVYDSGLGRDPQPETKALLRFVNEERPDCVVLSHSDSGSLGQPPDSFIPERFRQRQAQLGALIGARCKREGAKVSRIPATPQGYAGEVLYQSDVIYHASGALPLVIEFPCGYRGSPGTFDEILDVGMYSLEELMAFGCDYGFRPPEEHP